MAELNPSGDLSEIMQKLMSDEKFMEMAQAVKESISADADNTETIPVEVSEEVSAETGSSPVAGIPKLSPELMAKLPEIMSMLSHDGTKKLSSKMEDRKRLLNAMKPFLSEKRRIAVDSIVNIAGFADLFGL